MDIKAARKILNLSQEQFAQKLEVSVRTIGNWEKGTVAVPPVKIEKIKALVANARECCDYIEIGNDSPGAGSYRCFFVSSLDNVLGAPFVGYRSSLSGCVY